MAPLPAGVVPRTSFGGGGPFITSVGPVTRALIRGASPPIRGAQELSTVQPEAVEDGHRGRGGRELATASAVVAENAAVLQASERVLDAGTAPTVAAPGANPSDPVAPDDGDAKASDGAVPTVGQQPRALAPLAELNACQGIRLR